MAPRHPSLLPLETTDDEDTTTAAPLDVFDERAVVGFVVPQGNVAVPEMLSEDASSPPKLVEPSSERALPSPGRRRSSSSPSWPPEHIGRRASLTIEEIRGRGPAKDALPFPAPDVRRARRDAEVRIVGRPSASSSSSSSAEETATEAVYLLAAQDEDGGGAPVERAYRFIRSLAGNERCGNTRRSLARNGDVKLCRALPRARGAPPRRSSGIAFEWRPDDDDDESCHRRQEDRGTIKDEDHYHEEELVVVKEIDKRIAGAVRDGTAEASAMQYVRCDDNARILSSIETLEDDRYLYVIMPYCEGGDLHSYVWETLSAVPLGPDREGEVRTIFRSLLEGLQYLQSRQMCHGDVSPENVMFKNGEPVLADLDAAFLLPTASATTTSGASPAASPEEEKGHRHNRHDHNHRHRHRLLVRPRPLSSGKIPYMSPEVFLCSLPPEIPERCWARGRTVPDPVPYDGPSADLWCLGTTLYVMLTAGVPPYDDVWYNIPFPSLDGQYRHLISEGHLGDELRSRTASAAEVETASDDGNASPPSPPRLLSAGAIDLLERMLRHDPADRLTLRGVMLHPWVCGGEHHGRRARAA